MKKGITRGLCLFVLHFSTSLAYSQNLIADTLGDNYKISYKDNIGLYLYSISKFSNFELKEVGASKSIKYKPNENINFGLGINYKWLGLALSGNIFKTLNESDIELYGNSNSLDLQVDMFTKAITFAGNLQYYEGYYWQNPNSFIPEWNIRDSVVIRSDIKTFTMGLSGIYAFNLREYSFKAPYNNTEKQLKTAGSYLLGIKVSSYAVRSDSFLIPGELDTLFLNSNSIHGISAFNLGGAFGYGYTHVFENDYFANITLMLGVNLQAVSTISSNNFDIVPGGKLSSNLLFKTAFGCDKAKYYYGINISAESYLVKNSVLTQLVYSYGKIRLYYGRRFNLNIPLLNKQSILN